ncbi:MAG: SGNH/GDSL hydrolase family protein [Bacteroidales bacterium]|nr:SGNH/GDSL hydrolase family protein [Bacteroidales bacterium]
MQNTRRNFLKTALVGGLSVSALSNQTFGAMLPAASGKYTMPKGSVVLFQGDSITDWGRRKNDKNPNNSGALGTGYAFLAASELLNRFAGYDLKIYNRGISGNKVYQLNERWQEDCLDMKPSVLSILIGVNDFWHKLEGKYDGTVEIYERDYRALLQRTFKELPNVKLIICEPFAITNTSAVNDKWFPEFDGYREAAFKMSKEFDSVFIPYQKLFDKACKLAPGSYWSADGVHPSLAGAQLMSNAWMEYVFGK